jgi:hypothetical protein
LGCHLGGGGRFWDGDGLPGGLAWASLGGVVLEFAHRGLDMCGPNVSLSGPRLGARRSSHRPTVALGPRTRTSTFHSPRPLRSPEGASSARGAQESLRDGPLIAQIIPISSGRPGMAPSSFNPSQSRYAIQGGPKTLEAFQTPLAVRVPESPWRKRRRSPHASPPARSAPPNSEP